MAKPKRYLITHHKVAIRQPQEKLRLLMEVAKVVLDRGNAYVNKYLIPSLRYEHDGTGRNMRAIRGYKKVTEVYYTYQGISVSHLLNQDSILSIVRLDKHNPAKDLALFGKIFTGIAHIPDYVEKRGIFHYETKTVLTAEQVFSLPMLALVRTKKPQEKLTFFEPIDEDYVLTLLSLVQNPNTWLIGERVYGTNLEGVDDPNNWSPLSSSGM